MSKSLIGIFLIIIGIFTYFSFAIDVSTPAIWQTKFECNIYSEPISASGNYVFWGGDRFKKIYKLFLINAQGQKLAESVNLPSPLFDPIIVEDHVIAADHAGMLRAFSLPDLKVAWEASGEGNLFEKGPIKSGQTVLQGCGQSIFCFDIKNGRMIWDITEINTLKNFAADKVILTVHGYGDLLKPSWKCSAYESESGLSIWALDEPVSQSTPIFVKNLCILTTQKGEGLVIEQYSGKVLYRTGGSDFTQIKGLENAVIFVKNDFKNLAVLSLLNGKSWTTTIKKDFIGAAQIGSRVIIADKQSVRCFEVETGLLAWEKELGDIYTACEHRNGIFVCYKKSFTAKETYAICLGADTNKELWIAQGKSIFRKPYPLGEGDLLTSYDGTIRLMPKPVFHSVNVSMPEINMPDPSANINKGFDNKSGTSIKQAAENPVSQTITEPEPKEIENPDEITVPFNPNPMPTKEEKKKQIEKEIKNEINKEFNIGIQKSNKNSKEAIPKDLPTVSDQEAGW